MDDSEKYLLALLLPECGGAAGLDATALKDLWAGDSVWSMGPQAV